MTVVDEQPLPVDHEHLRSVVAAVLELEGFPPETEVSISLVTDEMIARHHVEAMGIAGPTDVLSFPLEMLIPGKAPAVGSDSPPVHLGDVVIAPTYVQNQATEMEVAFEEEISLLVTHGVLHLMGYDHEDDADAEVMEERERLVLAEFGMKRR